MCFVATNNQLITNDINHVYGHETGEVGHETGGLWTRIRHDHTFLRMACSRRIRHTVSRCGHKIGVNTGHLIIRV